MWSGRTLLSCFSIETTRKLSCGSGVLLGSVLLINKKNEESPKWNVEYSKTKMDDVLLSRKVKIIRSIKNFNIIIVIIEEKKTLKLNN